MNKSDASLLLSYSEIQTDETTTVEDVVKFLSQFPSSYIVRPYEGEGGNWILVEEPKQ